MVSRTETKVEIRVESLDRLVFKGRRRAEKAAVDDFFCASEDAHKCALELLSLRNLE